MKKVLIIGAILLVVGICISFGGFAMMGFDFSKLSNVNHVTQTYTPEGAFTDLSVTGVTCDIRIAKSENTACTVVCTIDDRFKPTVTVENEKLVIHIDDNLKWYQQIGFHWGSNQVTVYLPESTYNDLDIQTTTGDIVLSGGFTFTTVKMHTTTGDIMASSLSCQQFSAKVSTGDMVFRGLLTEAITLEATTGDVTLNRCDGNVIQIVTTTGDITLDCCDGNKIQLTATTGDVQGSLRTGKQFTANATTGKIQIPSDSGTGTCNIKTTSGDITIRIA